MLGASVCLYESDFSGSLTIFKILNRHIFLTSSIPVSSSCSCELFSLSSIPLRIASFLLCLAHITKGKPNFSLYLKKIDVLQLLYGKLKQYGFTFHLIPSGKPSLLRLECLSRQLFAQLCFPESKSSALPASQLNLDVTARQLLSLKPQNQQR